MEPGRRALRPGGGRHLGPGAARQTQLVFIGRETDADALDDALDACTVEGAVEGATSPTGSEPLTSRVEVVLTR